MANRNVTAIPGPEYLTPVPPSSDRRAKSCDPSSKMESVYTTPMRTPSTRRRRAISPTPQKYLSPFEVVKLDLSEEELKNRIIEQDTIITDLRELLQTQQETMTSSAGLNESIIIQTSNRISTRESRVFKRDVDLLHGEIRSLKGEIKDLRQEIANLEDVVRKRDGTIRQHEDRISELKDRESQLEAELKEKLHAENVLKMELNAQGAELREKLISAEKLAQDFDNKLRKAGVDLNVERDRVKKQEEVASELKRKYESARAECRSFEERLRRYEETQKEHEIEMRRSLENQLVSSSETNSRKVLTELSTISTHIININRAAMTPVKDKSDNGSLQEKIGELRATNMFLTTKIEDLEAMKERLEKEVELSRQSTNAVREELEVLRGQLGEAEKNSDGMNKYLHDENAKLIRQKADIRCELIELRRQYEKLKEKEETFDSTTRELEKKLEDVKTEKDALKERLVEIQNSYEERERDLVDKLEAATERVGLLEPSKRESEELKTQIRKMQERNTTLVRHLELADDQCAQYRDLKQRAEASRQRAVDRFEELNSKTRELQSKVDQQREVEREVATLKADNERLLDKIAYLNEELQETHVDYREELARLAKEVSESREKAAQLIHNKETSAPKFDELRLQLSQRDSELRSTKKRIEELKNDNTKLQEQVADVRSRETVVAEENAKLRRGLADAVAKIEEYKRSAEDARELGHGLAEQLAEKETRMIKLEDEVTELSETIKEKERLEGYLQSQINAKAMPKVGRRSTLLRTVSETSMESVNMSQVELLEKEKAKLREALEEKKRRLNMIRESKPVSTVTSSASDTSSSIAESVSLSHTTSSRPGGQGTMRHDIPHRWKDLRHMSVFSQNCAVCFIGIPTFGKAKKCVHCEMQVHASCAGRVVNTCGLPDQCASFYVENHSTVADTSKSRINGWLRIYRDDAPTSSWTSAWVLMDSAYLAFYDNDGADLERPMLKIDLQREQWVIRAGTEMPLKCDDSMRANNILQIKMPGRTIHLLAPSQQSARRWSDCLQAAQRRRFALTHRSSSLSENSCLLVLDAPNNLTIHQSYILDDYLLLATQTGLFFTSHSQPRVPVRIAGINCVSAIEFMPSCNCVCLVLGSIRSLALIPLDLLRSSLRSPQPSVRPDLLPNYQHVQLIMYHKQDSHRFLIAADTTRIHILKHNPSRDVFSTYATLDVNEPPTCLQSAPNGFFFGADSFYFVSLNPSHPSQKVMATSLATSHVADFPVAVLPIRDDEILLAYQNYGMFVNLRGERTRRDTVEWEHMPTEFVYTAPYLYVVHYDSIEIMQVAEYTGPDSKTILPDMEMFQCENAHVIGKGAENDVIVAILSVDSTEVHRFNATSGKRSMKRRGISLANLDKRTKN